MVPTATLCRKTMTNTTKPLPTDPRAKTGINSIYCQKAGKFEFYPAMRKRLAQEQRARTFGPKR